ncbi:sensor histidine kinase [Clostridium argentinense]|uniref:sensor histidine kinase n=1 Tax=Clostridium argentinense TaxID=29341 RepID=UPI001969D63E|nr:sensor histidine kinase [Clostridium argentinense]
MIKSNLFSKMVLIYTVIIFLSLTIIATFLSVWFNDYFVNGKKNQVLTQTEFIQGLASNYIDGKLTYEELDNSLKFVGEYFYENIYLINRRVYVFAATSDNKDVLIGKQIFVDELNSIEDLSEDGYLKKIDKKSDLFSKDTYVLGQQIKDVNGDIKGGIIVELSMSYVKESLGKIYRIIWLSTALIMILSMSIIYLFTDKIVIKPLQKMSLVARKIANGDVAKRVEINTNDEIGQFAKAFNSMADSLEKVEKNRKEFISNVSHDIRSPITSINGFIRGILDGVVPKEKEKEYLTVAYEETQRLTRLVNDLLDMSAIEEGRIRLALRKIDINEIIRLSILKNEAKIKEKRVKVEVYFDSDELLVYGDPDRIFQVVMNLLDNAIKYSNEGALITLSSNERGKKAYISVSNTGSHIDEESLKTIWERFYKGDKSRTNRVSSGLGLSIVKKILTMLDEEIWAENTEDGVKFTFTLTLA